MDVLTDVMQTVRVRSHLYGRLELTAPWGIRIDAPDLLSDHSVNHLQP